MSHVPGNLIFKRWLNALKSPSGFVIDPNPPIGGFMLFDGETPEPVPPETVMGLAATTRNNFLALTTLGVDDCETFEAYPEDDIIATIGPVPSGVTGALDRPFFARLNGLGRYNTNPVAGIIHAQPQDNFGATVFFSANLAGFGWFVTDPGDFDAQWTMQVTDENDVVTDYPINHTVGSSSGNLVFWGFLDFTGLLYKSVKISGNSALDSVGLDGVYLVRTADLIVP